MVSNSDQIAQTCWTTSKQRSALACTVPLASEELTNEINKIVLTRDPNDTRALAITKDDIGHEVIIEGNVLNLDCKKRPVHWKGVRHSNCTGTITAVEEKLKGQVTITGTGPVRSFPNPQSKAHVHS